MRTPFRSSRGLGRLIAPLVLGAALGACADGQPVSAPPAEVLPAPEATALQAFDCVGSTLTGELRCRPAHEATVGGGASGAILIGGQGTYLRLTSSNVAYDSGTEIFSFDVTVQNLLNEAIGTFDGITPDPDGVRVFFHAGPTVTSGTGVISVANADGTGTFTAAGQPYFQYDGVLTNGATSAAKNWQLSIPASATNFTFTLFVEAEVQYLLVINEVMTNPVGTTTEEQPREWFEIYNAGTLRVEMQNLVIADSAASGRRPYHQISSSLVVLPGGYLVLGGSTNTTTNGGVPVDYSYGTSLSLANSLDAVKIARVVGADTLTIDRTQYSNATVSAQDGISRELKNPALDNSNMDGSNWASASVTAVYGVGGRGTPKAQNSAFTP